MRHRADKFVLHLLCSSCAPMPAVGGSFVLVSSEHLAIVKINKVVPRDSPAEAAAKQERSQYAQWWTSAETLAYYNGLKQRFNTEILVAKPALSKLNAATGVTP